MSDAALQVFRSLSTFAALQRLVDEGEAEGLYIECKAPSEPRLTREMKVHLAKALSGFSNTSGGVLLYGVSTTKHAHTGLDVLTQIEPIGQVRRFNAQLLAAVPTMTTPPVLGFQSAVVTEKPRDSRGVALLLVPSSDSDPVVSNEDNVYYFRSGDDFRPAPHDLVKRLFSAVQVPDVYAVIDRRLVKRLDDGSWSIPISLENRSNATARDITMSVRIVNPSACDTIASPAGFHDVSAINPEKVIYISDFKGVVHRGLNMSMGDWRVKMKVGTRPKRRLDLAVTVYADRMRARKISFSLKLAKKGFAVTSAEESSLY